MRLTGYARIQDVIVVSMTYTMQDSYGAFDLISGISLPPPRNAYAVLPLLMPSNGNTGFLTVGNTGHVQCSIALEAGKVICVSGAYIKQT